MVRRIARKWILLATRTGAESESVTAVCNVTIYQTLPNNKVIMRAVQRTSRCYSFLKDIESLSMFFCNQHLTSTQKKETIRISFCNHRVTSPPHKKDLKRAGICINESDRPRYLNSFLVTSSA